MPGTVLVLEHEPGCMVFLRTALTKFGYTVQEAVSSDEVIRLCSSRSSAVELLIMDLSLWVRSGIQTARMLKQVWPSLPVLYISGLPLEYWSKEGLYDFRGTPGCLFLEKPFRAAVLREYVTSLIECGRSAVLSG